MDASPPTPHRTRLRPTLARLRAAWQARKPDCAQRRDDLRRLRDALRIAARRDGRGDPRRFRPSLHAREPASSEAMIVLTEIDHALQPPAPLDETAARRRGLALLAGARGSAAAAAGRGRHHRALELPGEPRAGAAGHRDRRRQPRLSQAFRAHAAHQRSGCASCWPRCSPPIASRSPPAAPTSAPRSPRCRSTTCCSPARPRSGAR